MEHLAHHREIVARRGFGALDVELAIGAFQETVGACDDHRADRIGPLDMAVVVNLDPPRRRIEVEQIGQTAQQPRLGRRFGKPPVERFPRVTRRLLDQLAPLAALADADLHLAPGQFGKRFG